MSRREWTQGQSEVIRLVAEELLRESNQRGDQNERTVAWAVNFLLNEASK